MNIFRYACKEPGKSILVENSDSKELEVVDSVKLKCKNDRSWNITEKTKIKTCVCKYIQKLWSCNHILVSLAYLSNSTYFMIWCIIRIIIRIIITGSHCTDPPRPPLDSNLRIIGWDGAPIRIGTVEISNLYSIISSLFYKNMLKGRDKMGNWTTIFIISGNHIHLQRWYENERWFW